MARPPFRGFLRRLTEPAEDPRLAFPEARELRVELLDDLRSARARLRDAHDRLAERVAELGRRQGELEELARQALAGGDEAGARATISLRQLTGSQLVLATSQLGELEAAIQRLSVDEQRLATRIEAYAAQERLVGARRDVADARVRVAEALAGLGEEHEPPSLADAESRVVELEARAEAIESLLADGTFRLA
jgi:phage shock protein A